MRQSQRLSYAEPLAFEGPATQLVAPLLYINGTARFTSDLRIRARSLSLARSPTAER